MSEKRPGRTRGKTAAHPGTSPARTAKARVSRATPKKAGTSRARQAKTRASRQGQARTGDGSERRSGKAASFPSARLAATLLNLEESLSKRIMGKQDAVTQIADIIRVRMARLDLRPSRPYGTFLLVGPTGVGKNELAYALCEALYGTEQRVVSIDLGELDDEEDLAKLGVSLIPGSDTHVLEGLLTSPVRRDPQAVVLLRGLERAHDSLQPVLQQILEHGRLDDIMGPVSFSETIVFVTLRPRREDSAAGEIGFGRASLSPEDALRMRLETNYAPDFLNAFNTILDFPPLTTVDVRRIARFKVERVLERQHLQRREIVIEDGVFEDLILDEQARKTGASSLNRILEAGLFNPLARYLLSHRDSRRIRVGIRNGALEISRL